MISTQLILYSLNLYTDSLTPSILRRRPPPPPPPPHLSLTIIIDISTHQPQVVYGYNTIIHKIE